MGIYDLKKEITDVKRWSSIVEDFLFNHLGVVGLAISNACLIVSHDVLGLTSLVADNISANGVGLALGTAFRYVTYRRFVFTPRDSNRETVLSPR